MLAKPYYWLGNLDSALLTVAFVNIWRSFPILYAQPARRAACRSRRDVIESAAMDGAGPLRRFVYITMPHLKAVSLTLIFIHIIWTAINFDFIWVMTQGGPLNSSETLPIMIYRYAFEDFDVGAASALAMMTMGFMLAVVLRLLVRRPRDARKGRRDGDGRLRARRLAAAVTYATLAAFAAFCLFPFLWMLDTALKPAGEVRSLQPDLLDRASDAGEFPSRPDRRQFPRLFPQQRDRRRRLDAARADGLDLLRLCAEPLSDAAAVPQRSAPRCWCRR